MSLHFVYLTLNKHRHTCRYLATEKMTKMRAEKERIEADKVVKYPPDNITTTITTPTIRVSIKFLCKHQTKFIKLFR